MSEQQKMDAERAQFVQWLTTAHVDVFDAVIAEHYWAKDHISALAWQARASLPVGVPDGYALVPVEPTPEMVSAAEEAHMPFGDMDIALRMAILSAPAAEQSAPDHIEDSLGMVEQSAPGEVEEVEVVGWLGGNGYHPIEKEATGAPFALMTVAQHKRIVAALSARQSAHVSVPRELLADLVSQDHDTRVQAERRLYYALLNGGEA